MTKRFKYIEMFTDGACSGNPGPGGWATILRYQGHEKVLSGGAPETTNNRMELTAVVEGLKALNQPCVVVVILDSMYVCNGVDKGWAERWQKNNWIKSNGVPAKNPDLWEELLGLLKIHHVQFSWIQGHSGHKENERCDAIAVEESRKFKS